MTSPSSDRSSSSSIARRMLQQKPGNSLYRGVNSPSCQQSVSKVDASFIPLPLGYTDHRSLTKLRCGSPGKLADFLFVPIDAVRIEIVPLNGEILSVVSHMNDLATILCLTLHARVETHCLVNRQLSPMPCSMRMHLRKCMQVSTHSQACEEAPIWLRIAG